MSTKALAALAFALVAAPCALGAGNTDPVTRRLAADRGCSVCHADKPAGGEAIIADAPSWHEIASRYAGRKDAEEYLARIVVTGSDPGSRHWKRQAQFTQMLPNAIAVTPEEARQLVRWILAGAK